MADDAAIDPAGFLAEHPAWRLQDGRLVRGYRFTSFVEAFGFMASAALVAESSDHHPSWTNVWNRVDVELWTHTADAITAKDIALATAMEGLAGGRGDG